MMHGFAPAPRSYDHALSPVRSTWRRVVGLRVHARVCTAPVPDGWPRAHTMVTVAALELSRVARPFLLEAARAEPHGMETAP